LKSEDALAQNWPSRLLLRLPTCLTVATGNKENQGNAPLGAPHSPALGESDLVPGAVTDSPVAHSGDNRSHLSGSWLDLESGCWNHVFKFYSSQKC